MAQAFITTYQNYYRWPDTIKKLDPIKPRNFEMEVLPEGDWIKSTSLLSSSDEISTADEEAVKQMYKRRMKTTYKRYYCQKDLEKEEAEEANEDDIIEEKTGSSWLDYCSAASKPKPNKILSPLPTSRRVYGYLGRSVLQIPKTLYESTYGQTSCDLLNGGKPTKMQNIRWTC